MITIKRLMDILNMFQAIVCRFEIISICRAVGDLRKPHYESHVSVLMS